MIQLKNFRGRNDKHKFLFSKWTTKLKKKKLRINSSNEKKKKGQTIVYLLYMHAKVERYHTPLECMVIIKQLDGRKQNRMTDSNK